MGSCVRRDDNGGEHSATFPAFMKPLYLHPSPHLVFKWQSDHFGYAAKALRRAKPEITPCHFFLNIQQPPSSATGFVTAMR